MAMVFEACVPEFEKLYLDLLNGAIFFFGFFQIFFCGWGLAFFSASERFWFWVVLGRLDLPSRC